MGGPDKLRRLQEHHSISHVVVAIGLWSIASTTIAATASHAVVTPDHQRLLSAGQQVPVMTDYVVERFGMILECRYIAWVQGSRITQGVVTHSDL
jgi:hypothetical protein